MTRSNSLSRSVADRFYETPWPELWREIPVPFNPDRVFQRPWEQAGVNPEECMAACSTMMDAMEVVVRETPPLPDCPPKHYEVTFIASRYAAWIRAFVEHHGPDGARDAARRLRTPSAWGLDTPDFEAFCRGLEGEPDEEGPAWAAHLVAWQRVRERIRKARHIHDALVFAIKRVWPESGLRCRSWVYSSRAQLTSAHFAAWVCAVVGLGPGACYVISGRYPGQPLFWNTVIQGMSEDYDNCERARRLIDRVCPVDLPELPPPEFRTPRGPYKPRKKTKEKAERAKKKAARPDYFALERLKRTGRLARP